MRQPWLDEMMVGGGTALGIHGERIECYIKGDRMGGTTREPDRQLRKRERVMTRAIRKEEPRGN